MTCICGKLVVHCTGHAPDGRCQFNRDCTKPATKYVSLHLLGRPPSAWRMCDEHHDRCFTKWPDKWESITRDEFVSIWAMCEVMET